MIESVEGPRTDAGEAIGTCMEGPGLEDFAEAAVQVPPRLGPDDIRREAEDTP